MKVQLAECAEIYKMKNFNSGFWITYYFFAVTGIELGRATISGNAQQRRKAARAKAEELAQWEHGPVNYKVWKYRKGEAYTSGSFNK